MENFTKHPLYQEAMNIVAADIYESCMLQDLFHSQYNRLDDTLASRTAEVRDAFNQASCDALKPVLEAGGVSFSNYMAAAELADNMSQAKPHTLGLLALIARICVPDPEGGTSHDTPADGNLWELSEDEADYSDAACRARLFYLCLIKCPGHEAARALHGFKTSDDWQFYAGMGGVKGRSPAPF